MRIFVVGDIHGAYKAFKQCLERSGFDYNNDRLVVIGETYVMAILMWWNVLMNY